MARFSNIVNSFIGGEISPQHQGRTDIQELYRNGCARLENFVPSAAGGVVKRSGTRHEGVAGAGVDHRIFLVGEDSSGDPVVFVLYSREEGASTNPVKPPFKGDIVDGIMFGVDGVTTTADYIGSNVDVTISPSPYDNVRPFLDGALYDSIYDATTDPATSGIDAGFMGLALSYYYIDSDAGESLAEAQTVRAGDATVIVHPRNPPIIIINKNPVNPESYYEYSYKEFASVPEDYLNSDGSAVTSEFAARWILGTPFRDIVFNKAAQPLMSVSGTLTIGGTVTVTITNALSWGVGFTTGHIGALFMSTPVASETGVVIITAVTDSITATGIVLREFGGTGATSNWREASWSNARGWPRTVTYFQGRLFYGGNTSEPDRVWASQAFDIGQMSPRTLFLNSAGSNGTAASTDPFQSSILSTKIQWMANNDNNIFIGSSEREYIATVEVSGTTSSLSVSPQTNYGSSHVQAVQTNNTIVFVGADGYTVREMAFNFNDDNFVADSLSRFADHLIDEVGLSKTEGLPSTYEYPKIISLEIQNYPETRVLCLTNKGGLYSLTRNRQLGVFSWSRFKFNGPDDEDTLVTNSVNSITSFNSRVYISVTREKFTAPSTYISQNRIESFVIDNYRQPVAYSRVNATQKNFYLDMCTAVTSDAALTTATTGSAPLSGLSAVRCLTIEDGVLTDHGDFDTTSGGIVIADDFDYAFIGVNFNADIITLPIEAGSRYGNAQGEIKRIEEVILRFYKSVGCSIAPAEYALEDYTSATDHTASIYTLQETRAFQALPFVPANIELNKMLPLYTGDISVKLDSSYDTRGQIFIRSNAPYPCVISAIVMKGVTYDD